MADVIENVILGIGEERRITLPGRGAAGFTWSVAVLGDDGIVALARMAGPRPPLSPPGGPPPDSYSLDELIFVTGSRAGAVLLDCRLERPDRVGEAPAERRLVYLRIGLDEGEPKTQTERPITGPSCQPPPSRQ